MSSIEILKPLKCSKLYSNADPCPALRTNLSLFIQLGFLLEIFKKFLNNTVPTSAIPNGIPGCPEFAFSTDEAERTLMDLVTLSNTD
jgi:hypothetical protein